MTVPPAHSLSWAPFARDIIERAVSGRVWSDERPAIPPPALHSGVFVTLRNSGRLRGCMGTLDGELPLAEAVREAAVCAALHDPRFRPVTAGELKQVRIEVSILSALRPMRELADLEIGRHGILVRQGPHRGLFLPQVASEHHLEREQFLSRCCAEKAGLPPDAWRDPKTEVLLFTTECSSEPD